VTLQPLTLEIFLVSSIIGQVREKPEEKEMDGSVMKQYATKVLELENRVEELERDNSAHRCQEREYEERIKGFEKDIEAYEVLLELEGVGDKEGEEGWRKEIAELQIRVEELEFENLEYEEQTRKDGGRISVAGA